MMGKLSDILDGSSRNFDSVWDATEAAGDFGPIPTGDYVCHATKGELESSRTKKTPSYKIEFTVIEGDFKGRKLWHDCWLTAAALPQTKRDLAKFGIKSPEQMELPLPRGFRCKVAVILRKDDDGSKRNRIRSFGVIGIDDDQVIHTFASPQGDAIEPNGAADTCFNPNKS